MMDRDKILEIKRAYQRKYEAKIRTLVLTYYGGTPPKCACCGETEQKFLALDHINGGGTKHRKEIKVFGSSMNQWLRRNNFPEGFQVLCHNCNSAKGYYGHCPHVFTKN